MKKIIMVLLIFSGLRLHAISATMNHRLITSSPLLYKQTDYSYENLSIEFEPLISQTFDPEHITSNLILNGKTTLTFDQGGNGDFNSAWIYLGCSSFDFNYTSKVTFTPSEQLYGLLFHTYKQFEHLFIDVRTSLLQSKSMMEITETSGGNGGINNTFGNIIYNAYDAFTQNELLYGKAGVQNNIIGFDNIQILFGTSTEFDIVTDSDIKSFFAGFALVEVPTGAGTTSEWMFEPQVGTNHWGIGFGFDAMILGNHGYSFVFGGNFRHLIANWETRSFDLTANGQWSRYLLVTTINEATNDTLNVGTPGINIFTQDALIEARNQITMYGRLEKRFEKSYFEFSYNLFYNQAESIRNITNIPTDYGIYAIGADGGLSTASTATISEGFPYLDSTVVELVTSDLNLASGAAGQWLSNSLAARLQREEENYTYGIGASIDLARTDQALSSWAVWVNFEILLS